MPKVSFRMAWPPVSRYSAYRPTRRGKLIGQTTPRAGRPPRQADAAYGRERPTVHMAIGLGVAGVSRSGPSFGTPPATVDRSLSRADSVCGGAQPDQVGFKLGDHGQHVETQPSDRVMRVVHRPTQAEPDLAHGELLGDRPGVGQRAGQ